jgi:hypothetical protein
MKTNRQLMVRQWDTLYPYKYTDLTIAFADEDNYLFEVKLYLHSPNGPGAYEISPYYDLLDLERGADRYETKMFPSEFTETPGILYREDLEAYLMDHYAPVGSGIFPIKVCWGLNTTW